MVYFATFSRDKILAFESRSSRHETWIRLVPRNSSHSFSANGYDTRLVDLDEYQSFQMR